MAEAAGVVTDMWALRTLERIVTELRVIEGDLPASYIAVFLYIAELERTQDQPPTLSDVADNLGIGRATVSRIVQAMGSRRLGATRVGEERPTGGRKALGLLERMHDPVDLRMVRVRLTPKGKGLLTRLTKLVREASTQ